MPERSVLRATESERSEPSAPAARHDLRRDHRAGEPHQALSGQRRPRRRQRQHGDQGGRDRHLRRPVRLREVHDAQDDQPADRTDRRPHPHRRRGRHRHGPGEAAPQGRVRDPVRRSLPAHDGRAEHRPRTEDGRLAEGPDQGTGRGDARPRRARPGRVPRPLSAPALRRSAATRGRGTGVGRRPARPADGRAVRRGRPDHPRPPPGRADQAPARAAQDDRLRHARLRRGDQARRPDRRPARTLAHRAVRHPGGDPHQPGRRLRVRVRGRGGRPEAAEPDPRTGRGDHRLSDGDRRRPAPGDLQPAPGQRHERDPAARQARTALQVAAARRPDARQGLAGPGGHAGARHGDQGRDAAGRAGGRADGQRGPGRGHRAARRVHGRRRHGDADELRARAAGGRPAGGDGAPARTGGAAGRPDARRAGGRRGGGPKA